MLKSQKFQVRKTISRAHTLDDIKSYVNRLFYANGIEAYDYTQEGAQGADVYKSKDNDLDLHPTAVTIMYRGGDSAPQLARYAQIIENAQRYNIIPTNIKVEVTSNWLRLTVGV